MDEWMDETKLNHRIDLMTNWFIKLNVNGDDQMNKR